MVMLASAVKHPSIFWMRDWFILMNVSVLMLSVFWIPKAQLLGLTWRIIKKDKTGYEAVS
jgi:hypothetical protein